MGSVAGCGMIPICMKDNELYVLCGMEKNRITDLGGKINRGESVKKCAAREFYEESAGLFMSYDDLMKSKVYKSLKLGYHKSYVSLVIRSDCVDVEDPYKHMMEYIKKNNSKMVSMDFRRYNIADLYRKNIYPKGFFELQELKWLPLDDLKKGKYLLRGRFKLLLQNLETI